jgi:IclR family transcriptional regulator, acetate operon repressor
MVHAGVHVLQAKPDRRNPPEPRLGVWPRPRGGQRRSPASRSAVSRDASPSSVDNALRVLLLFRSRQLLRVSDVAEDLQVARSTAHRLLVALVNRGFASQDPVTRAYTLGPVLTEIGMSAVAMMDVRAAAKRPMAALADRFHETISLVTLEGGDARFLDSIESPYAVRVGSRNGQLLPAHCVSGGKALLSRLPRTKIDELYPEEQLVTITPSSISKKSDLLVELDRIRRKGYATNASESERGLSAVAVVIDGPGTTAALAIAAPSSRVPTRDLDKLGRSIIDLLQKLDQ